MTPIVGTAGWNIPRAQADKFGSEGSALTRYATRFGGVEINSSFHRPHRRTIWERWAASVPDDFRFAVKAPKTITHGRKLVGCEDLLGQFMSEAGGLGAKLGVLLVQLPPSLVFDAAVAEAFFSSITSVGEGAAIACEPRNPSWFDADADALLERCRVARVAADPAPVPVGAQPGGWRGLSYFRLHGSPQIYRSSYEDERIAEWAKAIHDAGEAPRWCMFDNTASSAATGNALDLAGKF